MFVFDKIPEENENEKGYRYQSLTSIDWGHLKATPGEIAKAVKAVPDKLRNLPDGFRKAYYKLQGIKIGQEEEY